MTSKRVGCVNYYFYISSNLPFYINTTVTIIKTLQNDSASKIYVCTRVGSPEQYVLKELPYTSFEEKQLANREIRMFTLM